MLSFAAQTLRSRRYGASHSQLTSVSVSVPSAYRGFTLVELLTVIAIIGILSAITFGVVKGVNERAAIGQAKAELGTIAQALESYKRQYGDYPQTGRYSSNTPPTAASATNTPGQLFNALLGKLGPTLAAIDGKSFIDASTLSLAATTMPTSGNSTAVANAFLDPWGRQYVYAYRATGSSGGRWPSYSLVSAGPDGRLGITYNQTTGQITESNASEASDNIYSNK